MSEALCLACSSAHALAELLQEGGSTATLLVPQPSDAQLEPFRSAALRIELPNGQMDTACEVLQILPRAGVVVRLLEPDRVQAFAQRAQPAAPEQREANAEHSEDEIADDPRPRRISAEVQTAGTTALSWPIERLRTDWHSLSQPEKIRIARYGKRPARNLVLKSNDKKLMVFLLQNTHISADEVALMAGMASLDPDLLRRIASAPEWVRHTAVARNLVCNPKLPSNLVKKLVDKLPLDELRRLVRAGKVRSSTKQMIMRRVDRGR